MACGRADVGEHTYGDPIIHIYGHDDTRLQIGRYTSMANGVTFLLGGYHPMDRVTTFPLRNRWQIEGAGTDGYPWSPGDIVIGSDAWIGLNATILSGVRVGDGAVIGAGAVVARNVPPYGVVAGNPARLIRRRCTDSQVEALLRIAWWDWPDDVVARHIPDLCDNGVDYFLSRFG